MLAALASSTTDSSGNREGEFDAAEYDRNYPEQYEEDYLLGRAPAAQRKKSLRLKERAAAPPE